MAPVPWVVLIHVISQLAVAAPEIFDWGVSTGREQEVLAGEGGQVGGKVSDWEGGGQLMCQF